MLTLATLAYLRGPDGAALLAEAAAIEAATGSFLQALTRLRRTRPQELAAAALETLELRRRAAKKFTRAEAMFFTRDALEQATSERVASHTAKRFREYPVVADLCCGIGGDTIALASETHVIAVDRDPLRLAIARANVEAHDLGRRVQFVQAEVRGDTLPVRGVSAAFCDPSRRGERGRVFDVRRYEPPLGAVLELRDLIPELGIKVAPGIPDADVPPGCEAEFVQEEGELKEAVLWLGSFASCRRRASLLPGGHTLTDRPISPVPVDAPRRVLYEPAPAVIRAHLVEQLAIMLDAAKLDDTIAYLTASEARSTPFARVHLVDEWHPFNLKALQRRLRMLDVGSVTIKKRGSPLEPRELERLLKLSGAEHRVLVLTRVRGRHSVLICRPLPG